MIKQLGGIKPQVDVTAYVHSSAEIIGRVKIARDASVWPGAVLRGDVEEITIGEGSNIQDNAVVHTNFSCPAVIGKMVVVGHGAILHGCRIGDNCLIGMGAIIMDGAVIGNNCVIGAGSVVVEKTIVPQGSLFLGSPARAVRKLTPEEIRMIQEGAGHYIQKIKEYKRGLRSPL
ncbi:MAG: gamma carbonic anhydrase family protein [Elusimicrobiota bacterium]